MSSAYWSTGHGPSGIKGVPDGSSKVGMMQKFVKDVSHNDEKIGRKGVTLPETIAAIDPSAWDAIEKHCSFASVQKFLDPVTPIIRKPSTPQHTVKTIPIDTVEGLVEVKLHNNGG